MSRRRIPMFGRLPSFIHRAALLTVVLPACSDIEPSFSQALASVSECGAEPAHWTIVSGSEFPEEHAGVFTLTDGAALPRCKLGGLGWFLEGWDIELQVRVA